MSAFQTFPLHHIYEYDFYDKDGIFQLSFTGVH